MKNMRDHLFSLGASAVLTLSVVLAQDQAPIMPPPLPAAPAPAEAAGQQPPVPAVPAIPAPVVARPVAPAPVAAVPRPAVPKTVTAPAVINRKSLLTGRRTVMPTPVTSGAMVPPLAATDPDSDSSSEPSAGGEPKAKTTTPALKFDNAPVEIILQAYAQETGKTLLMAPDAPKANVTLKSQPDVQLTKEEYIEAIEVVLSMHGIVLEPFGEKFVKVFARKTVRTEGIKIIMESPEGGHPEKSKVVSQMIQLKSITIAEAQKALEGFKKADGLIQAFERTNSLLVTDTQENVNRMLEIVKFIDQPLVAMEEVNVRVIRFAKADDIKKRLEELVAESQKQTQAKEEVKANVSGSPGMTRSFSPTITSRPMPPGLSRFGTTQPAAVMPNEVLETLVNDADRGMIRGKVQIISDERSNQLIIITRTENMNFFDRIITVLDIETAPDVRVEVQRLQFADAEEVSTKLNELIGNATAKKDEKVPANAAKGTMTPGQPGQPGAPEQPAKSASLAETLAARAASRTESMVSEPGKSKLGQLSKENIKILADKRTNALVMMGSIGDLAAIKEIIKGMDIQLDQVLIEMVVLQVGLNDDLKTGIDWVKRVNQSGNMASTSGGGGGTLTPKDLFGSLVTSAASNAVAATSYGISYFATIKDLRLDAVVSASKADTGSKVLSSPVLLTVDNKEATMESKTMRYLYKGVRYSGNYNSGTEVPDFEQRDIGLTVKVTPRINPAGMVVLTIEEKYETVGANQAVGNDSYPTVNTRNIKADVSVENGQTVILGGLVENTTKNGSQGIPILKDIPYVGKYLFGSVSSSEERSELLVFLTPYVIKTQADMDKETRRRKDYVNADGVWTKGWSDSKLADPVSEVEMKQRLERKKALEKAWQKYNAGQIKLQAQDAEVEQERAKEPEVYQAPESSGPAAAGHLDVSETVEVVKPTGAAEGNASQPGAEPVRPPVEEPKKHWWKLF